MTNQEDSMSNTDTLTDIATELSELDAEIRRLLLTRERTTYKLEQAIRERDRLTRHIASSTRETHAEGLCPAQPMMEVIP
jgi:hypothetical protein